MNRIIKLASVLLLAFIIMFGLTQIAYAAEKTFPLMTTDGTELIADADTKYIAYLEQDPTSKMITASFIVKNGNPLQKIVLGGVGLEISFTGVVPYQYDPTVTTDPHQYDQSRMFLSPGTILSEQEILKYCYFPVNTLNTLGSMLMQNNNNSGHIGGRVSSSKNDERLIIDPGESQIVAQIFFMPINGTEILTSGMFDFEYVFWSQDYISLSTWLGEGADFVLADRRISAFYYVYSPNTFKMHFAQSAPLNLSADNDPNDGDPVEIEGYNAINMEWSYDGVTYSSGMPIIKNEPHTIYVRMKGTDYTGTDTTYGLYKMLLPSESVAVTFGDRVCTVIFDGNGGTPAEQTRNVEANTAIGANMPAAPVLGGCRFKEWNTAADGTGAKFTSTTIVTGDIRVYAQWDPIISNCTVTFDGNGGTPEEQTRSIEVNTSVGADMPGIPEYEGFTFDGWNTAADGSGASFTNTTLVTSSIRVYAKWNRVPVSAFTVRFDSAGGSVVQDITVSAGEKIEKPADPIKESYKFKGWLLAEALFDFNTPITGDITLKADWEPRTTSPIAFLRIAKDNAVAPPALAMARNSTQQFTVIVNEGATPEGVVWSVQSTNCVLVDAETGLVTILDEPGTAVLIASAANGVAHSIILRVR